MVKASGWIREAVGIVAGPARLHPYQGFITRVGLDALARVAALAGDLACAQAALDQADALAGPAMRLFDTWSGPIHAWVAAARGEVPAAVELALSTAAQAGRCGQLGCELIALHDVARLGAPTRVAARLAELAAIVQGDLASLFTDHVQALVAADGTALDAVAASFAALGANLLAAEAAAAAARRAPAGRPYRQRRGFRGSRCRAGRGLRGRPDAGPDPARRACRPHPAGAGNRPDGGQRAVQPGDRGPARGGGTHGRQRAGPGVRETVHRRAGRAGADLHGVRVRTAPASSPAMRPLRTLPSQIG